MSCLLIDFLIEKINGSVAHQLVKMDYDEVLDEIGGFGWRQRIQCLLMWLPTMAGGMTVFSYDLLAYIPEYRCKIESCESSWSTPASTSFLEFTTPKDNDGEWDKCHVFNYSLSSSECPPDHIDQSVRVSCPSGMVFNDEVMSSTAVTDLGMWCDQDSFQGLAQVNPVVQLTLGYDQSNLKSSELVHGWNAGWQLHHGLHS